jgi:glycosyltransferase involved in cell wall biosynthesis
MINYNGVSIIICTYNGSKRLPETLLNICKISFFHSFELIVVDNDSKDNTIQLVTSILENSTLDWKIVNEHNPGLSHARWKGIFSAKYDIVLFCDDDNYLAENYLEIGFDIFNKNLKVGVLGGLGEPIFEGDKPNWFDAFSHSYAVGTLGKVKGIQKKMSYHYGAACFFLKRSLLHLNKIGFTSVLSDRKGDSLSSGGDVELCFAVQLLGYQLYYSNELHFKHFIEKHRLNRSYYLKLKKGISDSFPLLTSYEIHKFRCIYQYKKYLFKLLCNSVVTYLYIFFLKVLLVKKENSDIALVVSKSKIEAFFNNYRKSIRHFLYVNSLFNKVDN